MGAGMSVPIIRSPGVSTGAQQRGLNLQQETFRNQLSNMEATYGKPYGGRYSNPALQKEYSNLQLGARDPQAYNRMYADYVSRQQPTQVNQPRGGGGGGGGGVYEPPRLARFTGGTTGVLPDFEPYQDYLSGNLALTQPQGQTQGSQPPKSLPPKGRPPKGRPNRAGVVQSARVPAATTTSAAGVPAATTTPGSGLPIGRSYTALVDDKGQTLSMRQAGTYGNSPFDMAERDRMQMLSKDIAATTDPSKKLAMQMFAARQLGRSMSLSNPSRAGSGSAPSSTRKERIAMNRFNQRQGSPEYVGQGAPGVYRIGQGSPGFYNPQQQRPWYLNV